MRVPPPIYAASADATSVGHQTVATVPLVRGARITRFSVAAALLAGISGAAAVVFLFDPAHNDFYPVCLFHQMTGLNCPGCGATRALHALMHGHFADAARDNALFLLCLPYLGGIGARTGVGWLTHQRVHVAISANAMWTLLVMSVMFGILRNMPGFEWMSP